jgi:hypothetical protein
MYGYYKIKSRFLAFARNDWILVGAHFDSFWPVILTQSGICFLTHGFKPRSPLKNPHVYP